MPMIESIPYARKSEVCALINEAKEQRFTFNGIPYSQTKYQGFAHYTLWVSVHTDLEDIDEAYNVLNGPKHRFVEVKLVPDEWLWMPVNRITYDLERGNQHAA